MVLSYKRAAFPFCHLLIKLCAWHAISVDVLGSCWCLKIPKRTVGLGTTVNHLWYGFGDCDQEIKCLRMSLNSLKSVDCERIVTDNELGTRNLHALTSIQRSISIHLLLSLFIIAYCLDILHTKIWQLLHCWWKRTKWPSIPHSRTPPCCL
jgi:hypothetical protein